MAGYKTPAEAGGRILGDEDALRHAGCGGDGGVHRRRGAKVMEASPGTADSAAVSEAMRTIRTSVSPRTSPDHEPERHQHTGNLKSRGHETRRRNTSLDDETRDETTNTSGRISHSRLHSAIAPYHSSAEARAATRRERLVGDVSAPLSGFRAPPNASSTFVTPPRIVIAAAFHSLGRAVRRRSLARRRSHSPGDRPTTISRAAPIPPSSVRVRVMFLPGRSP